MAKLGVVQTSADIVHANETIERDGSSLTKDSVTEDAGNASMLSASQDERLQVIPRFLHDRNFPVLSGIPQHKNVSVNGHRTSIRLEKEMWDALNEVAANEGCSINELCAAINELKNSGVSFTSLLRAFLFEYYRHYV